MGLRVIPEIKRAFCDRCGEESEKPWARFRIEPEGMKNTLESGSYAFNHFPKGIDLCEDCLSDLVHFMKG